MKNCITDIENLFWGKLDSEEQKCALDKICSDDNLFHEFISESVIESQIYSSCRIGPEIKGLENETKWKNCIECLLSDSKMDTIYSEEQWNHLIHTAINKNHVTKPFFTNSKFVKYLVAACLVLMFMIMGDIKKIQYGSNELQQTSEDITIVQSVINKPNTIEKSFITDTGNGLLFIDKKTAGIIERKSKITYAKKDTSVFLDITSGSALFTVEKGKYKRFIVITPHAQIIVTGTVFRVDATADLTKVTVVEGSVIVKHISNNCQTILSLGNTALADRDSISFFETEESFLKNVPKRKLLKEFLSRNLSSIYNESYITEQNSISTMHNNNLYKNVHIADSLYHLFDSKSSIDSDTPTISKQELHLFITGADFCLKKAFDSCDYVWNQYLLHYPNRIFTKTVVENLVELNVKNKKFKTADSLIRKYLFKNNPDAHSIKVIKYVADNARINQYYDIAIDLYEYIMDVCSDKETINQTAYWAGWCIINLRIPKNERALNSYKNLSF